MSKRQVEKSARELAPLAEFAFEIAAARVSEGAKSDVLLQTEIARLRQTSSATSHSEGASFLASDKYDQWRQDRIRFIESERAKLAAEMQEATRDAKRQFGISWVLQEIAKHPKRR